MDNGMRSLHPAATDHSVSIRGSRCTALIHPFASEPSGSALLSTEECSGNECRRYGAAAVVTVVWERKIYYFC